MKKIIGLSFLLLALGCKSNPTSPSGNGTTDNSHDSLAYVFEWDGAVALSPNNGTDGDMALYHPKLFIFADASNNYKAFVRKQRKIPNGDTVKVITDSNRATAFSITNSEWHVEWINYTATDNGQTNSDTFIFDGQLVDSANTSMKQIYPSNTWVLNKPPYLQGLFKSPGPRSVIGNVPEVEMIWFNRKP